MLNEILYKIIGICVCCFLILVVILMAFEVYGKILQIMSSV